MRSKISDVFFNRAGSIDAQHVRSLRILLAGNAIILAVAIVMGIDFWNSMQASIPVRGFQGEILGPVELARYFKWSVALAILSTLSLAALVMFYRKLMKSLSTTNAERE